MGYKREDVHGVTPQDLKKINDNFRNLWQKTFGNLEFADFSKNVNQTVQTIQQNVYTTQINVTNQGNTITDYGNTITNINNTVNYQGNTLTNLGNTVTSQGQTITSQGTSITNLNNQIVLKATQTSVDSLTGRVSSAESSITQNATDITLRVKSTDYNGNTIASLINQTATTIQIAASKINLTGYITATNLSTPGATTINGSNIKAGTITLGGASNGNGAVTVKDASNNDIVYIDRYGIRVYGSSNFQVTDSNSSTNGGFAIQSNLYCGAGAYWTMGQDSGVIYRSVMYPKYSYWQFDGANNHLVIGQAQAIGTGSNRSSDGGIYAASDLFVKSLGFYVNASGIYFNTALTMQAGGGVAILIKQGGDLTIEAAVAGNASSNLYNDGGYLVCTTQIQATNLALTSGRDLKVNIQNHDTTEAYELVKKLKVHKYQFDKTKASDRGTKADPDKTHIGIILDESPEEFVAEGGKGIEIYSLLSNTISALQEVIKRQEEMYERKAV